MSRPNGLWICTIRKNGHSDSDAGTVIGAMWYVRLIIGFLKMMSLREVRVGFHFCPLCNGRRLMVKLCANEMGVRCLTCRASAATMSMVHALRGACPDLFSGDVYEMSSRGPLVTFLHNSAKRLTCSEFFPNIPPGQFHNGVQCQDVQCLTYPDASFDICTSTEVFEHIPDDARAFAELHRVLKPNGVLVFTVPLHGGDQTIERAVITAEGIQQILPPEYHGDPFHGTEILALRNYGRDIIEKLCGTGFSRAEIIKAEEVVPWGYARPVVVAYK